MATITRPATTKRILVIPKLMQSLMIMADAANPKKEITIRCANPLDFNCDDLYGIFGARGEIYCSVPSSPLLVVSVSPPLLGT